MDQTQKMTLNFQKTILLIALLPGLMFVLPPTTPCQNAFTHWLRPLGVPQPVRASANTLYSPRERVKEQDTDLEFAVFKTSFSFPLSQSRDREWIAVSQLGLTSIHTRALLPDTGDPVPSELWDINVGLVHRQRLSNGWTLGANFMISSPSDRPFNGWYEMAIMLNGFLRIPSHKRNAWVFFLNYSTNREFLPHTPIPGAGYLIAPSPRFNALVGIPLISISAEPATGLKLTGLYFPIHSVYLGAKYNCLAFLDIFTSFRWVNDRYFRAGREDRKDRLFWYEKRLEGGVTIRPTDGLELILSGGYAFDRFFFEGESYDDDRLDNRVDVGNGPFISARAAIEF